MSSASSQLFWKSTDPEATQRAALAQSNARIQELSSQQWDPNTATIGGIRDYQLCCLAPDASGVWVCDIRILENRARAMCSSRSPA